MQGGSSITQQLAKNLFLNNERTIERKVKEAFLATWLETRLSKNDILKLYLDRAYMGGGTFGVDAAAQYYFGKSARDVKLAEGAMLAGLFKAPTRFAPHVNLPAARARASTVLDNLIEAGFMTEGQVFGARRHPATAVDRRDERQPNYYLDWAFEEMKRLVTKLPKSVNDRVFIVRLGLDTGLQRTAEDAVENLLRQYGKEYHAKQAATVVMDIDGTVRAMVGGRDYGASQFNRATDALRQPGSSFKPYVYATAFDERAVQAHDDHRRRADLPRQLVPAQLLELVRRLDDADARAGALDQHGPGAALGAARRRQPQQRQDRPRQDHRYRQAHGHPHAAAGFHLAADRRRGGDDPRPYRARSRRFPTPARRWRRTRSWRCARRRASRSGASTATARKPVAVLRPQVAMDMNMILNKAVEEGTGRRAIVDGVKAAGKTGTTNAYRDAWFVGYTGNYVAGVWAGNDDYGPTNRMTGGSLPAMIWKQIMSYAHQGIEIKPIPGVAPGPTPPVPPVPVADANASAGEALRPTVLTRRAIDVLLASSNGHSMRPAGPKSRPGPPQFSRPCRRRLDQQQAACGACGETELLRTIGVADLFRLAPDPVLRFVARRASPDRNRLYARIRGRGRSRNDMARGNPRRRLWWHHDGRLEVMAEDRNNGYRSLCARDNLAHR